MQYINILVWIGVIAVLIQFINFKRPELVFGEWTLRYYWVFSFVVFLPVIWMAGSRGIIGDTAVYITRYKSMPTSFADIPAYARTLKKDAGFYIFAAILHVIFGDNTLYYFMTLAIIQGIAIVYLYRKYSPEYVFSIFLFIASSDYISWMFNGIRQFMAVSIILFATSFMVRRKYIPAVLIILIASSMHRSALLMIPIMIIGTGRAWNKRTLLFIAAVLLAIIYVGQFTSLLDDALENTQYANVISDYTSWGDDGTNPLRVLVYSVPALISFYGRRIIEEKGDALVNFCANMSIVSAGLYLISMATSGIFIGRLPIYASLYAYILLPWEIEHVFSEGARRVVRLIAVAGYIGFYYVQMHLSWHYF